MQVYMLINVGVVAYVVGTFTLVVTKDDEAAGHRRELAANLRKFLSDTKLDKRDDCDHLRQEMRRHIDNLGDDQVRTLVFSCMALMHGVNLYPRRCALVPRILTHTHAWLASILNRTTMT